MAQIGYPSSYIYIYMHTLNTAKVGQQLPTRVLLCHRMPCIDVCQHVDDKCSGVARDGLLCRVGEDPVDRRGAKWTARRCDSSGRSKMMVGEEQGDQRYCACPQHVILRHD